MRLLLLAIAASGAFAQTLASGVASTLDFQFFKTRVQPIFLERRRGDARCYVCHSIGRPFRLERLSPGATTWNDEQSRRNFEAARREVVPGNPQASRLLMHPLAEEAGGHSMHSGGKHWDSPNNRERQAVAGRAPCPKTPSCHPPRLFPFCSLPPGIPQYPS